MSENASSRNSISWNWFCQGLVHTVRQDSCPTGTRPVGNCMNLSLAKPSSMILSSWKRYIYFLFWYTFFNTPIHENNLCLKLCMHHFLTLFSFEMLKTDREIFLIVCHHTDIQKVNLNSIHAKKKWHLILPLAQWWFWIIICSESSEIQ